MKTNIIIALLVVLTFTSPMIFAYFAFQSFELNMKFLGLMNMVFMIAAPTITFMVAVEMQNKINNPKTR